MLLKTKKLLFCLLLLFFISSQAAYGANPSVSGGRLHSIALKDDGTVWTWGFNYYGQLGDGNNMDKHIPAQISGLNNITAIAGGGYITIILKNDGTVWTCGWNKFGQLGDGSNDDNYNLVQADELNDVKIIAGGATHTLAIKKDGTVWTWGANSYGKLGDGTTENRNIPTEVSGINNAIAIAAGGNHTVALKNDGTVWTWGRNNVGQLGIGDQSIDNATTPVNIPELNHIIAIASGGNHALAVKNDGTVWTWGDNSKSQLGIGTTDKNKFSPVQIADVDSVKAIACGINHSIVIKNDGTVWTWGDNSKGQLGIGTTDKNKISPVQIPNLANIVSVVAGESHTIAIKDDGTVWTWGDNSKGELGDETTENRISPIQTKGADGVGFLNLGNSVTHTIIATSDNNGKIEPSDSVIVREGTIGTFRMLPNAGYEIDEVKADDISVGAMNTYSFAPVYKDHRIHVTFKTLPVTIPEVGTLSVTKLNASSVTVTGNIISDGGATLTDRGVCWSNTIIEPTLSDNDRFDSATEDSTNFTVTITNLTPGKTYYVRAYATNSAGTGYGDVISFTMDCLVPTVTTGNISDITSETAISGGEITDNGGCPIIAKGVCWSISENPTIDDAHTTDGTGMNSFTSSITGLTKDTTYYVRAYVTNSAGTGYGDIILFTTDCPLPTVTTGDISDITSTTAISGGEITDNGGCPIIAKGVCWSISENPTIDDAHTIDGTGMDSFTSSITGLTKDTTYYVRAYATNQQGTGYGDKKSFKTLTGPVLSVTPVFQEVSKTSGTTIFEIENIGTETMAWTISEDAEWFSIDPVLGTDNDTIIVTYDANLGDSRTGEIIITASDSESSSYTVEVRQATVHDGDIDNNGSTELEDAILGLKIISGTDVGEIEIKADINNDQKIGMEDVIYIIEFISDMR